MKHLTHRDLPDLIERLRRPHQRSYLAMYSSVFGGIVTDPALMLVPIDDHMVHRGDGVFETMKCVDGAIYNMAAHLDRLERSAAGIHLQIPEPRRAVEQLLVETARTGGERTCALRLFVSRGPGSFGVNPYDAPAPQIYTVATLLPPPFMVKHPEGARLKTSRIPAKPAFFAGIKNCNYLPNVLMQKESVDAGVDFVTSFDAHGCMAEGPTENVGIVTRDRRVVFPALEGILAGTTMLRVAALAGELARDGHVAEVEFRPVPLHDLVNAAEILIVGTTRDVIAVREFDGRPVGTGKPGPVWRLLSDRLTDDMHHNAALRTPVWEN